MEPQNRPSRVSDALAALDSVEAVELRRSPVGQLRLSVLATMVEDECDKVLMEWGSKPDDSVMEQRFRDQVFTRVRDKWNQEHMVGMGPIMITILANLIWWFIKNVILE